MNDIILQLGVGFAIVFIILDKVFNYLKSTRKVSNTAGEQSIDYWRDINKQITEDVISNHIAPILRNTVEILARIEARSGQNYELCLKQTFVIEELKSSLEKLRMSNHEILKAVQVQIGRRATDLP